MEKQTVRLADGVAEAIGPDEIMARRRKQLFWIDPGE
jgi:hypothetical protein